MIQTLGSHKSHHEEKNKMSQDKLREIMLRAYMKGENLKNINAEELIADIARDIKGKNGA